MFFTVYLIITSYYKLTQICEGFKPRFLQHILDLSAVNHSSPIADTVFRKRTADTSIKALIGGLCVCKSWVDVREAIERDVYKTCRSLFHTRVWLSRRGYISAWHMFFHSFQ